MTFKMLKWYGMLVWNFYAIGGKIMILLALKAVNTVKKLCF